MIKLSLSEVMRENGMNIQQLHDRSGVSRNTIRLMMNNEPKGIQFDSLNKLIEVLNCSVEDIIQYIPGSIEFFFTKEADASYLNVKTEFQTYRKEIRFDVYLGNNIMIKFIEDGVYVLKQILRIHPAMIELFSMLLTEHAVDKGLLENHDSSVVVHHGSVTYDITKSRNTLSVVSMKDGHIDKDAVESYAELIYLDGKDKDVQVEKGIVKIEYN